MPPAFNLSQDQTLQFNPSNNRHKRLFANRFTDPRSLLLTQSPRQVSPPKGISYVYDFIQSMSTKLYLISPHPASPTARYRAAKPQAQAPSLRPKPRIPHRLFRPYHTHQAPAAPSTPTYRLYIVKERSAARNTASGKEAGLYSAG